MSISYSFISFLCNRIIASKVFEAFILLIIIWNTIMLCMEDPNVDGIYNDFDDLFLYIYTVEMALKIFAMGFISNKNAYLRTFWNWMDFTIVTTGYIPFVLQNSSINITGLRSLRVLRPLRAISFLEELKKILTALVKGIPNFLNVMIIYFFFLSFFGITSLQLFTGILKKRCYQASTGLILQQSSDSTTVGVLCGAFVCPGDYICGKLIENPDYGVLNFDNILWSLVMIFQAFTTNFSYFYIAKTFNYYGALIFFIFCSFVGIFLLLNLMLSVISSAYSAEEERKKQIIKKNDREDALMTTEEYKKIKYKNSKYKILIDFSIEYVSINIEDVLPTQILREKQKNIIKFENDFKTSQMDVHSKFKTLTDDEKNMINQSCKWRKRLNELTPGIILTLTQSLLNKL